MRHCRRQVFGTYLAAVVKMEAAAHQRALADFKVCLHNLLVQILAHLKLEKAKESLCQLGVMRGASVPRCSLWDLSKCLAARQTCCTIGKVLVRGTSSCNYVTAVC